MDTYYRFEDWAQNSDWFDINCSPGLYCLKRQQKMHTFILPNERRKRNKLHRQEARKRKTLPMNREKALEYKGEILCSVGPGENGQGIG